MVIKRDISEALVLISPDFTKPILIFTFASFYTIAAVTLQKNQEGHEQPIAYFSKSLSDTEIICDITKKQAYALVKVVKHFRPYLVGSEIVAYNPNVVVKDIFK